VGGGSIATPEQSGCLSNQANKIELIWLAFFKSNMESRIPASQEAGD
jgi:hypothetical protein